MYCCHGSIIFGLTDRTTTTGTRYCSKAENCLCVLYVQDFIFDLLVGSLLKSAKITALPILMKKNMLAYVMLCLNGNKTKSFDIRFISNPYETKLYTTTSYDGYYLIYLVNIVVMGQSFSDLRIVRRLPVPGTVARLRIVCVYYTCRILFLMLSYHCVFLHSTSCDDKVKKNIKSMTVFEKQFRERPWRAYQETQRLIQRWNM
jgi:hypothetical protein